MKAWQWIKDHAQLVGAVVVAILGAIGGGMLVREARRTGQVAKKELAAIDAGKKAAQDAVVNGAENAVALLEKQHKETIEAFDAAQKAKYDRLRSNPRELAKTLTRLSK